MRRLGALALCWLALSAAACNPACCPDGVRPTAAVQESYVLEYARLDEPLTRLVVDKDAHACMRLRDLEVEGRSPTPLGTIVPVPTEPEPRLYVACILATNIDGQMIAGEAFGQLNEVDTNAMEAIFWRARLDGDASVCEHAGLLAVRLDRCHAAVAAEEYRVTDGRLTVVIPRGPGPRPSG